MSAEDKESMKYQSEKCLKVLGFTKAEYVSGNCEMLVVSNAPSEENSVWELCVCVCVF